MRSRRNARGGESLDYVGVDSPRHRADEAVRGRRRIRRADLEQLRDERRIVWDPVSHDDSATRARYAHHLFRNLERLGRKHRAENTYDQIERSVRQLGQIGSVAFLKATVRQALSLRALIPGGDEVFGDVDAQHVGARSGLRYRGGPVPASEVEHVHALRDPETLDQGLPARCACSRRSA